VNIIAGTINANDIVRSKGKIQIPAKQYMKALAESMRECIDPETGLFTMPGDVAKQHADMLQEIGEKMK
jgi:hypothetical protein